MSDNTILGTKPFSDYMSVAEAALKVMQPIDEQGLEEVDKVLDYHRTQTEKRSVAFARKFYQKGEK